MQSYLRDITLAGQTQSGDTESYRQLCADFECFLEANPTSTKTIIEYFFDRHFERQLAAQHSKSE